MCARVFYLRNSYFVPDKNFRNMLCTAATRGVDTRVLTVGNATDIKSTLYAGRAHYEELVGSGVRIYEYRLPAGVACRNRPCESSGVRRDVLPAKGFQYFAR